MRDASSLHTNRLPCTPSAPITIAASVCLLPVAMPPAAINGIPTARSYCGYQHHAGCFFPPVMPAGLKGLHTTASQPACSAFWANLLLLTTCTTVIASCFLMRLPMYWDYLPM